ncbi:MAG: DedA family protein [Desulfuromonadales bacterium]|nr:DedA family protein [Desulfuromonadales bacterium]MDT8422321.1 YqaA family protein [Desulfuromonadales bacterium]
MKYLRGLYNWVLSWAETAYAVPALFLLAFAESSFFPVPPDVLMLALCLSLPHRSWYYAAVTSIGSVLGGIGGYVIGFALWHLVSGWFFSYIPGFDREVFSQVQEYFTRYNFWVVFAAGFSPIPYKVITIGAGVFNVNFPVFLVASAVSRSLRFFLVAGLIRRFGAPMRELIDRYFNLLSLVFVVLLIGGFVVIKYLLH